MTADSVTHSATKALDYPIVTGQEGGMYSSASSLTTLASAHGVLTGTKADAMPATCRIVFLRLAGHCGESARCSPSRATLAGECGVSIPTLDAALRDLANHGWISKVDRFEFDARTRLTNEYEMHIEKGQWWDAAKYKMRGRAAPGTVRQHAMARDNCRCRYCGEPAEGLDHVIPRSRGGTHRIDNVVACCRRCNSKKGTCTPAETGMTMLPEPQAAT